MSIKDIALINKYSPSPPKEPLPLTPPPHPVLEAPEELKELRLAIRRLAAPLAPAPLLAVVVAPRAEHGCAQVAVQELNTLPDGARHLGGVNYRGQMGCE